MAPPNFLSAISAAPCVLKEARRSGGSAETKFYSSRRIDTPLEFDLSFGRRVTSQFGLTSFY